MRNEQCLYLGNLIPFYNTMMGIERFFFSFGQRAKEMEHNFEVKVMMVGSYKLT